VGAPETPHLGSPNVMRITCKPRLLFFTSWFVRLMRLLEGSAFENPRKGHCVSTFSVRQYDTLFGFRVLPATMLAKSPTDSPSLAGGASK
jgi:hypothetical protein